jgi:hypothetical protein
MISDLEYQQMTDEERLDLLERPEDWPEDPAIQGELAQLLELHLGLMSLGPALESGRTPERRPFVSTWLLSAAALFMVAAPLAYHQHHQRIIHAMALDQARIQEMALKRGQDRLWSRFFEQSSALIQEFQRRPPVCGRDQEDHNEEREVALGLLEASHELEGQTSPGPQAEALRSGIHAWLTELSMEDGCLDPTRAEELRRLASSQNLQDGADQLGRLLKGDRS